MKISGWLITTACLSVSAWCGVGRAETAKSVTDVHGAQNATHRVAVDRLGMVTLINQKTGRPLQTFRMDRNIKVRETFLLDNGKMLAASQADHTIFWNTTTGREVGRLDQRVQGFSHDQTKLFTWHRGFLYLYSYPSLKLIGALTNESHLGVEAFLFSPDDRYLVVQLATGRPEPEEFYPNTAPQYRSIRYTRLFDTVTGQESDKIRKGFITTIGRFSADSKKYFLDNQVVRSPEGMDEGNWALDLSAGSLSSPDAQPLEPFRRQPIKD